jgi:hypothetical protein
MARDDDELVVDLNGWYARFTNDLNPLPWPDLFADAFALEAFVNERGFDFALPRAPLYCGKGCTRFCCGFATVSVAAIALADGSDATAGATAGAVVGLVTSILGDIEIGTTALFGGSVCPSFAPVMVEFSPAVSVVSDLADLTSALSGSKFAFAGCENSSTRHAALFMVALLVVAELVVVLALAVVIRMIRSASPVETGRSITPLNLPDPLLWATISWFKRIVHGYSAPNRTVKIPVCRMWIVSGVLRGSWKHCGRFQNNDLSKPNVSDEWRSCTNTAVCVGIRDGPDAANRLDRTT